MSTSDPFNQARRTVIQSLIAMGAAGLAGCQSRARSTDRVIGFFSPPIPENVKRFEGEIALQFSSLDAITIRFIDCNSLNAIHKETCSDLALGVAASSEIATRLRLVCPELPLVFASGPNPVTEGLAESFERPNKGATGFTYAASTHGRCAELLRACAPNAKHVGVVLDDWYLSAGTLTADILGAFVGVDLKMKTFICNNSAQLNDAINRYKQERIDAFYFPLSGAIEGNEQIAADMLRAFKLPAVFPYARCVEQGGLISYEATIPEPFKILARQCALVLNGVPVGEIPIESPQNFRCAVNFETARQIGVAIPTAIALSADAQFGGRGI
jgi:ABC-type uncharacterized transport system substrate-binding protein